MSDDKPTQADVLAEALTPITSEQIEAAALKWHIRNLLAVIFRDGGHALAEVDETLLRHATRVIVLMLPGWEHSVGVAEEVARAKEWGIPVEYREDVDDDAGTRKGDPGALPGLPDAPSDSALAE